MDKCMRKKSGIARCLCGLFATSLFAMTGCSDNHLADRQLTEAQEAAETVQSPVQASVGKEPWMEEPSWTVQSASAQKSEENTQTAESTCDEISNDNTAPTIVEMNWENYFDGINGTAVLYDSDKNNYCIYNPQLADIRRSPCSTFKIVSSMIALEQGIIDSKHSLRKWSGEQFWNDDWNRDIDFSDAFRASCVWYFREIVGEIGAEQIETELAKLSYGNCDSSDWNGRLNTNNNNPALTGFWIESSLLISPKEQVEVMERIFGDNTECSQETVNQLKQVMLLEEETEYAIYGKTGMGKAHGIVVDSWYTGFVETAAHKIYFCVYLGETDNQNVSSTRAKEIAIQIVRDYLD